MHVEHLAQPGEFFSFFTSKLLKIVVCFYILSDGVLASNVFFFINDKYYKSITMTSADNKSQTNRLKCIYWNLSLNV